MLVCRNMVSSDAQHFLANKKLKSRKTMLAKVTILQETVSTDHKAGSNFLQIKTLIDKKCYLPGQL